MPFAPLAALATLRKKLYHISFTPCNFGTTLVQCAPGVGATSQPITTNGDPSQMNRIHRVSRLALAPLFAAVLLAACSSSKKQVEAPVAVAAPAPAPVEAPPPPPAPAPAPVVVAAAQPAPAPAPAVATASPGAAALRDGVAAYQKGQYRTAEIKLAESQKLGLNYVDELLQAHKTQAFVYCQTRRYAQCEKSFDSALSLDNRFDLTRAERGNPAWAATFAKARKRYPQ